MGRKKMKKEEKKSILTININENLLNKIDNVAEKNGDNRSKLIEKLIEEYIEKK